MSRILTDSSSSTNASCIFLLCHNLLITVVTKMETNKVESRNLKRQLTRMNRMNNSEDLSSAGTGPHASITPNQSESGRRVWSDDYQWLPAIISYIIIRTPSYTWGWDRQIALWPQNANFQIPINATITGYDI